MYIPAVAYVSICLYGALLPFYNSSFFVAWKHIFLKEACEYKIVTVKAKKSFQNLVMWTWTNYASLSYKIHTISWVSQSSWAPVSIKNEPFRTESEWWFDNASRSFKFFRMEHVSLGWYSAVSSYWRPPDDVKVTDSDPLIRRHWSTYSWQLKMNRHFAWSVCWGSV